MWSQQEIVASRSRRQLPGNSQQEPEAFSPTQKETEFQQHGQ